MKKAFLFLGIGLVLAGCETSSTNPWDAARRESDARWQELRPLSRQAAAECYTRQLPNAVARMKCLNDADAIVLPALGPEAQVAQRLRFARRLALAERVDRTNISEAQIELELAKIDAQSMSDLTAMQRSRSGYRR